MVDEAVLVIEVEEEDLVDVVAVIEEEVDLGDEEVDEVGLVIEVEEVRVVGEVCFFNYGRFSDVYGKKLIFWVRCS